MFYGADLAAAHDDGFGFLARAGAETLIRLLRRAGVHDGLVLDMACGTGIASALLSEAGYDVLGVDISPDALALARRRAPAARFEQASLHDFELPPCAAIACIGEGLCYTADQRAGRAAAADFFGRAHAALPAGGVLLFDVAEPGRERSTPRRSWHEGNDWVVCVEAWEEPGERLLRRRIVTFARTGGSWRRSDELHTLRLLDRDETVADLAAAGFRGRPLPGYGRAYRFRRGHAGFAAVA